MKEETVMVQRSIRFLTLDDLDQMVTISVEEASHILGVSRTATYEAIHRGEIAVVKLGRRVRVLAAPLRRLLSGDTVPTPPEK